MRAHYTLVFYLTIILTFISSYGQRSYPEWFIHPLQYSDFYLGYSYNETPAIIDAERTYCVYHECIAYGTLQIYDLESEKGLLKTSDYYYHFSPDSLTKIKDRMKSVSSKMVTVFPTEYIELFAMDSLPEDFHNQNINVNTMAKPDWVEKDFWIDDTYCYGVGEYTSSGNHNDAWKTAEERAIFKILSSLSLEVHKINVSTQSEVDENLEKISVFKIKYLIKNIEVIERYPDLNNKLFFALVRIKKKNMISPMLR